MFELLRGYKARKGHCKVPYNHMEGGKKLGRWVGTQRMAAKKGEGETGTLSAERRGRLEEVGMVWDVAEAEWRKMIELLRAYKAREGNTATSAISERGWPNSSVNWSLAGLG